MVSSSSPRGQLLKSFWHLFGLAFMQRGKQGEMPCLDNGRKVRLLRCPSHVISTLQCINKYGENTDRWISEKTESKNQEAKTRSNQSHQIHHQIDTKYQTEL